MTTRAHRLSTMLPAPAARWLRPKYHFGRELARLLAAQRGTLAYNPFVKCWIAAKPIGNARLRVAVRSYKELRRFVNFDHPRDDLVLLWLNAIDDCTTLYDIGAANGLEGFMAHAAQGCAVVFVEPFTPSIETILRTITMLKRAGGDVGRLEVVAAGCDRAESYQRMLIHDAPVPGSTYNTVADVDAYCRGGRAGEPVWATQWTPSVSIDSLHFSHRLPLPTHVKIDVDGFELRVVEGAAETLRSGEVRSWMIEISEDRLGPIRDILGAHGFTELESWEHYPGYRYYCGDHLFVRGDLADDYRARMAEVRARFGATPSR